MPNIAIIKQDCKAQQVTFQVSTTSYHDLVPVVAGSIYSCNTDRKAVTLLTNQGCLEIDRNAVTVLRLINASEANDLRRFVAGDKTASVRFSTDNGETPAMAIAQRKVTCRCCGQAITKGEQAIRFGYDFAGSGSWTFTPGCSIHLSCEPATIPAR